jgi:branched-chain amino acid aminotransferase
MSGSDQWVVWFNGEIVPETEARVPFRDRGFKFGDAVFDTTRTFSHRIFKLGEHIDRLFRSLAYLGIDPGLAPGTLAEVSEEVAARNLRQVPPEDDIWVTQRVSRGVDAAEKAAWPDYPDCTVIVECRPLPFKARARLYRDGLAIIVSSMRRPSPDALSPRAKTQNYLTLVLGDLEAKRYNPDAVGVLLDTNGNLSEGRGNNVFLVRDGAVFTPRAQYVLPGITRNTVLDLARENDIPVKEMDLDLFDAATADEAFITSTSYCICPIGSINGRRVGDGTLPGPITARLMDIYAEFVDCDWVNQYLRNLN